MCAKRVVSGIPKKTIMQKLDFTENTEKLRNLLKSDQIISYIDNLPLNKPVDIRQLTPLIIESKSNYDKITIDDPKMEILVALKAPEIYSEQNIGDLINASVNITIQNHQKVHLFLTPNLMSFYQLHYTIIKTNELCKKVLFQNKISEITDDNTVVFRILTENGLEIARYNKILTLLNDIIEIINKVATEPTSEPTINLLDSGSDTNLGIKTTIETSKSLFQIFKEVWDWVLNRKFYKNKLRNAGLMENLNVMVAIKEAQEKGAINEDTAKIYRETVIRRTEDLLELNVLPKDLVETKNKVETQRLLEEFKEVKMLESGNQENPT